MKTVLMLCACFAIFILIPFIFAAVKVSSDADRDAERQYNEFLAKKGK